MIEWLIIALLAGAGLVVFTAAVVYLNWDTLKKLVFDTKRQYEQKEMSDGVLPAASRAVKARITDVSPSEIRLKLFNSNDSEIVQLDIQAEQTSSDITQGRTLQLV